jgi:hypothetical protein
MKGLLLTLLAPSAFAQYQLPTAPLDAPPAASPIQTAPLTPALPALETSFSSELAPLSPLETLPTERLSSPLSSPVASPLAPAASMPAQIGQEAAPLSGLESLAAPSARTSPASLQSAFFDLSALRPDGVSGLGAAPETIEAAGPTSAETGALGRMYPRVAVIVDVLKGKASQATIRLIDILQQKGVRVVFVTNRPDRGRGSVDEVLTSRLPARLSNALLIASSAGAKIYTHSSKAKNPRPTIPNAAALTIEEWKLITRAVKETAKQRRLEDVQLPSRPEREAFSYKAKLPEKTNAEAFAKRLNSKLRSAGLPYLAEPQSQGFIIRAYRPHLAVPRIVEALKKAVHRDVFDRPQEMLVIADPKRSASLLKAFPKGTHIQAVSDEASLRKALGAVLGDDSLEKVSVNRSKLRQYLEWLRRKEPKPDFSGGGGSWGMSRTDHPRDLAFYKGVLMYELMGRLYRDMRNGEFQLATLDQAESRLRSMWMNPKRNYVRLPAALLRTAANEKWRQKHRKAFMGELMSAQGWLRNYYGRTFPNYPVGLMQQVIQNLVNLSSDGMALSTVELVSPFTGRRYLIHHRPARAELRRGPDGLLLVAEAYRFGREKTGLPDEVESKLLAMAMLKGYAQKIGNRYDEEGRSIGPDPDRKTGDQYLVNNQPVKQVLVNIEYHARTVPYLVDVEDLPKAESEITSLIERMEADAAFQREYKKNNEEAHPAAKKSVKAKKKAKRRSQ